MPLGIPILLALIIASSPAECGSITLEDAPIAARDRDEPRHHPLGCRHLHLRRYIGRGQCAPKGARGTAFWIRRGVDQVQPGLSEPRKEAELTDREGVTALFGGQSRKRVGSPPVSGWGCSDGGAGCHAPPVARALLRRRGRLPRKFLGNRCSILLSYRDAGRERSGGLYHPDGAARKGDHRSGGNGAGGLDSGRVARIATRLLPWPA